MSTAGHFLQKVLDESELQMLNACNSISDPLDRHYALRDFFHKPEIFEKVQKIQDPAWVSFDIFISGKDYEF